MNFKNINSCWIWRDSSDEPNQYVTFKQSFNLNTPEGILYISCDTTYAAYLNGKLVGFGQYLANPEHKYYDVLSLNDACVQGENKLVIEVYYQGTPSSCYAKGTPGLIYAIKTEDRYIPNENVQCRKTKGYKEGEIFFITKQLGPSFEYNASELSEFWNEAIYLDFSHYLPLALRRRPVKKLVCDSKTEFKPVFAGEYILNTNSNNPADRIFSAYMSRYDFNKFTELKTNEFTINEDNTYIILDLGGETAGYFSLELESSEDVRIDVAFGEHLTDGRVRARIGERSFAFTYYTKSGKNEYVNYFRRIGGKYLQLNFSGVKKPVKLKYAGLIKAEYPVTESRMPTLTDNLDRKIYKAALKTLKLCMHEHYEDTPWREQSLYSLDARNQTLFGYSAFEDNSEFIKASIELMSTSLRDDGLLKITAPNSSDKTIPGFTMVWLIWIAEYIIHTGDKSFLIQQEPKISRLINKFEHELKDGILPLPQGDGIWNFYDWAEGLSDVKNKEADSIYNLYFCLALRKLLEIDKHFRDKDQIIKIKQLYKIVKKGVNNTFYSKEEGLYLTFEGDKSHRCKLAQALALCSNVAKSPKKLRKKLVNSTDMVELSLSTKEFEYEALIPQIKIYGDYILKDMREIWGKMILEGADTFYETEKGNRDFENAGSLCHGWSALPALWYKVLFGKNYLNLK